MKRTIIDLFEESVARYGAKTFLLEKRHHKFEPTTYAETKDIALKTGAGLAALGIQPKQTVSILAEGCNDWITSELGLLYAGLQFTFGGSEPAPAPAHAPQTVTENFTLDASTLFPFDGSSLCEEGVKAVNDVVDSVNAKNIQNAAYDVKGYTDRIGSEAYNQTLSEKRAQAVADQLQAAGVAPEQLTVTGMGEADPVSTGCEGLRGNKLVDCLAPDRRVELSVTGEVTEAE